MNKPTINKIKGAIKKNISTIHLLEEQIKADRAILRERKLYLKCLKEELRERRKC